MAKRKFSPYVYEYLYTKPTKQHDKVHDMHLLGISRSFCCFTDERELWRACIRPSPRSI